MTIKKTLLSALLLAFSFSNQTQAANRWNMRPNGSITWRVAKNLPHEDHLELSGRRVSVVLRYGVKADSSLMLNKSMVWPMLRTIPNNTHASLMKRFNWDAASQMLINGRAITSETVDSINLHGSLTIYSHFGKTGLTLTRELFPSTEKAALIEYYTLTNTSNRNAIRVEIPEQRVTYNTPAAQGVDGSYTLVGKSDALAATQLKAGESIHFTASIQGYSKMKGEQEQAYNTDNERAARYALVDALQKNLILESPDQVINRMFAFSKVRASESIYETAGGPMHGPGGESYYAAIWANDQAEYVSPFFPFEGYEYGNASALNCYKHFAKFMNNEGKPIPSSIIAEGKDIWNGAGDRGDAAMIAHGAARYVLARASRSEAKELWPLIKWCLEFCNSKLNEGGVVASDRDELEGRFPSGSANLCTSTLYYDALLSSVDLCAEMGEPSSTAKTYTNRAKALKANIEKYFGREMKGFHTYQYYEGNDLLRSWICMPLVVGIMDRKQGTIDALFSSNMWTDDGLLTQEGSETFWDRSTLYALRGVYNAGEPDKATEFLHFYSNARLLGEHVPYAIEAWPEGSQRHLSAESGLYARIITEGMFGIRPTGFNSFEMKPELPSNWQFMNLRHVRAFNADFDICVKRVAPGKLQVTILSGNKQKQYNVRQGSILRVKL